MLAASAGLLHAPTPAGADHAVRTVTLRSSTQALGESALGGDGLTFLGSLPDGGLGVFSESAGNLQLVAREGAPAPGTPSGVSFSSFGPPVIGDAGRMAFSASLAGTHSFFSDGIWESGPGGIALVARTGDRAPGTGDNVRYYGFEGLRFNNAGQVAFAADLSTTGIRVSGEGIWAGTAGNVRLVVANKMQVPGMPSGTLFEGSSNPVLNDAGRTAFIAALGGPGISYQVNDIGIWSEGSGSLAEVARAGNRAPGTPAGVNYGYEFFAPGFNNAGQTAFAASLTGSGVDHTNSTGIWFGTPGNVTLVARAGSQAPDTAPGVTFRNSRNLLPVVNNVGDVAFTALLSGPGVDATNHVGIWVGNPANLQLAVRSGSHAPGTPDSVTFSATTIGTTLNNAGQILFKGWLAGTGIDGTNDQGIWATDVDGALHLIARHGDRLQVASGDFRTIDVISLPFGGSTTDGVPTGMNEAGQIAFFASFTDGSKGIFVSDAVAVPEPAGLAIAGLSLIALRRGRRQ